MGFYLTIGLATLAVAGLAIRIWQKTHCVAFVLGTGFLYYWSLYGAWAVIWSGGELDTYLYHKMFPVALDQDYFLSLVLYTVFILVVQLTVLWRAKPVRIKPEIEPLVISHTKIIMVAAVAGLLGYLLVKDSVSTGSEVGLGAYTTIRSAPLYTIYSILLHLSMFPASIGVAVWFCGLQGKYLIARRSLITFAGYAGLLGTQLLFCMMIGNRGEVMVCFVVIAFFYLANARRPRKLYVTILAAAAVAALGLVKLWRDRAFQGGGEGVWTVLKQALEDFAGSTETLSAHFSMYGVLHKHVPLTWGTSFVSLICSFIPRAIWPGRPDSIYAYYVQSVGATEGQGYTIHHATGWYLNFGVVGLVLGAFVLGFIWAELYNCFETAWRRRGIARLYAIMGLWTVTAGLPAILREGPETYKAVVFDYSLVPLAVMVFACSTLVLRHNRPSVALARRVRPVRHAVSAGR